MRLNLPWHRAVAVESRDGKRKLKGFRLDEKAAGYLPNPSSGGEGGWINAAEGDWIVRDGESSWAIRATDFERDWIEPVAEARRLEAKRIMAAQEEADAATKDEARVARNLSDAKRILAEKEGAVPTENRAPFNASEIAERELRKRERDGSSG